MINDSVRAKTKHSASYLQSTCSCGPIGREWKRVQAAHGLIMGKSRRKGMERRNKRGGGGDGIGWDGGYSEGLLTTAR